MSMLLTHAIIGIVRLSFIISLYRRGYVFSCDGSQFMLVIGLLYSGKQRQILTAVSVWSWLPYQYDPGCSRIPTLMYHKCSLHTYNCCLESLQNLKELITSSAIFESHMTYFEVHSTSNKEVWEHNRQGGEGMKGNMSRSCHIFPRRHCIKGWRETWINHAEGN
jgi:hypothetical protein